MLNYLRYERPETKRPSGLVLQYEKGVDQIVKILDNKEGYIRGLLPRTVDPVEGTSGDKSYQVRGLFIGLSKMENPGLLDWEYQRENLIVRVEKDPHAVTKSNLVLIEDEDMYTNTTHRADVTLLGFSEDSTLKDEIPIGSKLLLTNDLFGLHLVNYFDEYNDDFTYRLINEKNVLAWEEA